MFFNFKCWEKSLNWTQRVFDVNYLKRLPPIFPVKIIQLVGQHGHLAAIDLKIIKCVSKCI